MVLFCFVTGKVLNFMMKELSSHGVAGWCCLSGTSSSRASFPTRIALHQMKSGELKKPVKSVGTQKTPVCKADHNRIVVRNSELDLLTKFPL